MVWVLLKWQSCTDPYNTTVSVRGDLNQESWDSCKEFYSPGHDFVSSTNRVQIDIRLNAKFKIYKLEMVAKEEERRGRDQLEIHYVTPTIGMVKSGLHSLSQLLWLL